jgi:hypothetical protein
VSASVAITIKGRQRALPLYHWFERIDHHRWVMQAHVESVHNGLLYGFTCFMIIEPSQRWSLSDDDIKGWFYLCLKDFNDRWSKARGFIPMKLEVPYIRDMRYDD